MSPKKSCATVRFRTVPQQTCESSYDLTHFYYYNIAPKALLAYGSKNALTQSYSVIIINPNSKESKPVKDILLGSRLSTFFNLKNLGFFLPVLLILGLGFVQSQQQSEQGLQNWFFLQPQNAAVFSDDGPTNLSMEHWQAVDSTYRPKHAKGHFYLRTQIPPETSHINQPVLYINAIEQSFRVYLDQQEIYNYGFSNELRTSPGTRWHSIPLPNHIQGKALSFAIYSTHRFSGLLPGITISSESDLILGIIRQHSWMFMMGIFVILLGLFNLSLNYHSHAIQANISTFLFSFFLGIYAISRSQFRQLFFDDPHFWPLLMISSILICPLTLLGFIYAILPLKHQRLFRNIALIQTFLTLFLVPLLSLKVLVWPQLIPSVVLFFAMDFVALLYILLRSHSSEVKNLRLILIGLGLQLMVAIPLVLGIKTQGHPSDFIGYIFLLSSMLYLNHYKVRELHEQQKTDLQNTIIKDVFLANMSHELRTPLNAILGFSRVLSNKYSEPQAKYYVERIYDNGKQLLTLVNQILDLSKLKAQQTHLELAFFNLGELIEQARQNSETLMHKNNNVFQVDLNPNLPQEHYGDRQKIYQILLNLLSNAAKFTQQGKIELKVEIDHKHLIFRVSDTGVGIPEKHLKQLFQSFFQVQNHSNHSNSGTGLGLAISQNYAQLMNGKIEVQSKHQQGSTFSLIIPLVSV